MQSPDFQDKQIQTFLGSYTELKHDTLLYAKQSYAEKGGGGDEECTIQPLVRGFVEPNVAFWQKLEGLYQPTEDFYNQYNLFQNGAEFSRLDEFKGIISFYEGFAEKEMSGTKIGDDDYEKLRTTGLSFMAQPFGGEDTARTKIQGSRRLSQISQPTRLMARCSMKEMGIRILCWPTWTMRTNLASWSASHSIIMSLHSLSAANG